MEFFRSWTSAIAGVIIFTALCEIIVPESEMKKYVRLILGMIVTITLISPLEKVNIVRSAKNLFDYDKVLAFQQQKNYSEEEQNKIKDLYEKKLEQKIKESLESRINAKVTADIESETEKQESFGEIKVIYLVISQKNGFKDYADEIKKILNDDFGIKEDSLHLKFVKG